MPVSARKLAASFWEHYGGHKLDQAEEEPCEQHISEACEARQPLSPAPLNMPLHPPALMNCQTPGALKTTRGVFGEDKASECNMTSNQAAMLVNVLHRVRSMEESQSRGTVMFNKLRLDIENAASRIRELEISHKSTLTEMNNLLQRFGEQMAISRRNEQEKVRLTFLHLREEMEEERNTCRLLQMQNRKLTEDLTHANMAAVDACAELNKERKARELLEEVCNELAREIGEDKAEVEQLKQEQEESRERLEKELKLMRMAALWREEKVRSKLEEAKQELDYDGKQGMPVHEPRGKLEASDNMVAAVTWSGSQGETNGQAGQPKLLTQALEKMELEKSSRNEHNMEDISTSAHVAGVPAWLAAHFSEARSPSNLDNQLYDGEGNYLHVEMDMPNDMEHRMCISGIRKDRKLRRRVRTTGQQGQVMGAGGSQVRVRDAKNHGFWEAYCGNSAWPSSDDEPDKRHLIAQQNCTSHIKGGPVLKVDPISAPNLHSSGNLVVEDDFDTMQATQERKPSVFSLLGKQAMPKTGSSQVESLLNDALRTESPKKHSSSARFEVGKLGGKSEAEMGPNKQHSFSEDDASSYVASRTEKGGKQGRSNTRLRITGEEDQAGHKVTRNDNGISILNGTAGEHEVGIGNDSELDDFYFEPVRGPTDAYQNKPNYEDGVNKARPERDSGTCGDDACCGVVAKCSQVCKELKVDEKVGCGSGLASEGGEGNICQETMNKMSPWRSATGKPLQCLWPPSPDAFSIFGGSKRRGKAGFSAPASVEDEGAIHSHARRHASPAKQAANQLPVCQRPDLVCMRSNSLGAQLIKARVCDTEKPPKTSFRFSPLRRAISHG